MEARLPVDREVAAPSVLHLRPRIRAAACYLDGCEQRMVMGPGMHQGEGVGAGVRAHGGPAHRLLGSCSALHPSSEAKDLRRFPSPGMA